MLELVTNLELHANGPLWQELRQGVLPPACIQRKCHHLYTKTFKNKFLIQLVMSSDFEKVIRWMMMPSPHKRPDVNTLLSWPRIKTDLENRKKLAPLKYLVQNGLFSNFFLMISHNCCLLQKTCCRIARSKIWQNVCHLTNLVCRIFRPFRRIMPNSERSPSAPYSEVSIPPFIDLSDTDSPIKSFSLTTNRNSHDLSMSNKFANSTPVIRHGYNRGRTSFIR